MPVLMYGLEACAINATDITALEHPVTVAFMKIFNTKSAEVAKECQLAFGFRCLHEQILVRKINFISKYITSSNQICSALFANQASKELILLREQLNQFRALDDITK